MKFFFFLLISIILNAQIKINFQLAFDKKSAVIEIHNTSVEKYAIPIELTNIKEFANNDICEYFPDYGEKEHALAMNLIISNKNQILEPRVSLPYLDFEALEKFITENENCYSNENFIEKWKLKYDISDQKLAENNYYIFTNLVLLNPNQKIRFRVLFDLQNITNNLYPVKYYYLNKSENYKYQLRTEIKQCIYNYLTSQQKSEIKDYKLFIGNLESNIIECSTEN